jgi:hypothetical protein
MAKGTGSIFAPDVGGINDPVSADGSTFIRAASTQAKGRVEKALANAKTAETLGGVAIEAYKGKLLSDSSKEIEDTLSKLEGYGTNAVAAQANLDRMNSDQFAAESAMQIAEMENRKNLPRRSGFNDDPTSKDFLEEIGRLKLAESQKIMTRQNVLNRIASTVKRYTAMAPGWASDFRKAAAELTGISNIDVLGVHAALTEKNDRERAADEMAKLKARFTGEISTAYGVSPDEITPAHVKQYAQDKQLDMFAQNTENNLKIANATEAQKEVYFGEYVAAVQLNATASISKAFDAFREANKGTDITSKAAQAQIGGQVLAYLNDIEQVMVRDIMKKTSRSVDNPYPVQYATADKYAKNVKEFLKTIKDNLNSEGGWNAFTLSVQAAEGDYQRMINNMRTANPYIAMLDITKVLPDIVKLTLIHNDPKKVAAAIPAVGEKGAQAILNFLAFPQAAAALANAPNLPDAQTAVATYGETGAKVINLNAQLSIDTAAKKDTPLTDAERQGVSRDIITYMNLVNPTDPKAMAQFRQFVSSDSFTKIASQMTDAEKKKTFYPFFMKARGAAMNVLERIETFAKDAGADVSFDPNTGKFGAKLRKAPVFGESLGGSPSKELQTQLANINSVAQLMNDLRDEVFPGEEVPDVPTHMAELYSKMLENNLAKLEAQKAQIENRKTESKAALARAPEAARGATLVMVPIEKELKEINSKIDSVKKNITSLGAIQSRGVKAKEGEEAKGNELGQGAFNIKMPEATNAPPAPAQSEKGLRTSLEERTKEDIKEAIAKPATPLEKGRIAERNIRELERELARKDLTNEQKLILGKEKRDEQLLRLEAIGGMSEKEKDEFLGPGRTR